MKDEILGEQTAELLRRFTSYFQDKYREYGNLLLYIFESREGLCECYLVFVGILKQPYVGLLPHLILF